MLNGRMCLRSGNLCLFAESTGEDVIGKWSLSRRSWGIFNRIWPYVDLFFVLPLPRKDVNESDFGGVTGS